ncbi:hypothetical protein AOQ73_05675 [Bradyrhizobium pachyrhizi]|uniref:hypothetical protein n=1 Tax=Bradyrhizobium pachyrhizi TaxID=280333 RepID=UPI0007052572|nr:hypothetical protein [Bradyrhizobium pachyrhizi]KRQ11896.1 hypothetical protein AOQ73_05675 [Bradyrhizobium pachyrhizi]
MHTRSAKNKETGKFTVTVWDWNGVECFRGEFSDVIEADLAAQREERVMTLRMQQTPAAQSSRRYSETMEAEPLTIDEILAALAE